MCPPLIAAIPAVLTTVQGAMMATMVAVTAASAALSIHGQMQNQSSQVKFQTSQMDANDKQMRSNRDLATRAYLDQANAANLNLSESREAVAAKNFDQSRKAMEAKGTAIAAAAEAGVYGVSLTGLLEDFDRQEAMFTHRNEMNLISKQQQTSRVVQAYQYEAEGRRQSIQPYQPAPVAPVDYAGPLLQVAQSGIQAGMIYKSPGRVKY